LICPSKGQFRLDEQLELVLATQHHRIDNLLLHLDGVEILPIGLTAVYCSVDQREFTLGAIVEQSEFRQNVNDFVASADSEITKFLLNARDLLRLRQLKRLGTQNSLSNVIRLDIWRSRYHRRRE
jgi:hypothetical protein